MPKYVHRFHTDASLEAVRNFHHQSASMGQITPPPIVVNVHRAPKVLGEGDEMDFTLWMGPIPIRWLARIEAVTPTGFHDRQLSGPFKQWLHRHTFVALADGGAEILDEVEAEFSEHWFWKLLNLGMWLNMPLLFTYRAWKTRRVLRRNGADSPGSLGAKNV